MKIYFNGDSYVAGAELTRPATQGFAAKLSTKLNATFINQAESGSSNTLILRKMHEYLYQYKQNNTFPDLIVIGWSEFTREDWFINGEYKSISLTGPMFRSHDPASFKNWEDTMHLNGNFIHQMCKFYNRAIYNFHQELQHLNIPHVFFNAIHSLNRLEEKRGDFRRDDPVLKFDWGNSYFHPYDNSLTWQTWAFKNNYVPVTPEFRHFREDCQDAWTEIIYNYIKEKNIA
jgi:hypothetical protein